MICKDCPHLIKTKSVEIAGWWDLYCDKYHINHCPVTKANLKYLVCVEEEKTMESERNCNDCIWSTRDGGCSSWDCEYVDKREAYKAWKEKKERETE